MAERRGSVWYGTRRVGSLRESADHELLFAYDASWLNTGGFPISLRIPLSLGEAEVDAHTFFAGLLPEGQVRQRVARQLGVANEDDVGLLFALGADNAGAFHIMFGDTMPVGEHTAIQILAQDQFDRLVRSAGADVAALGDAPVHFSLAGVQEKQPVIFESGRYGLPDRLHPSTHILKFETLPNICFAEFMANDIARRMGLPVVATEFLQSGAGESAVPFLRIQRYDRMHTAPGVTARLHQEDVMQALGLPTLMKYQHHGGPRISDIAELLRDNVARPMQALTLLRDWQMFNCLAGNWDGHGKNLALLYTLGDAVPALAPFYDLVAIEFLNLLRPQSWAREMAFYVGGNHVPERITRKDWEAFAVDLKMPARRLLARLDELSEQMPRIAEAACDEFSRSHGRGPVCETLLESIRRRCHWTRNSIARGVQ